MSITNKDLLDAMNSRFDGVDRRLDNLEKRMHRVEDEVKETNEKMNRVNLQMEYYREEGKDNYVTKEELKTFSTRNNLDFVLSS